MSFILDALKKSQKERDLGGGPEAGPGPVATARTAEKAGGPLGKLLSGDRRRILMLGGGVGGGVLLLTGIAAYFLIGGGEAPPPPQQAQQAQQVAVAPGGQPPPPAPDAAKEAAAPPKDNEPAPPASAAPVGGAPPPAVAPAEAAAAAAPSAPAPAEVPAASPPVPAQQAAPTPAPLPAPTMILPPWLPATVTPPKPTVVPPVAVPLAQVEASSPVLETPPPIPEPVEVPTMRTKLPPQAVKGLAEAGRERVKPVDVPAKAGKFGNLGQELTEGQRLEREGRYEIAIERYEQVVASDPQSVEARLGMGWSRLSLDQPEAAISDFSAAAKIAPGNPDPLFGRAWALERLGQLDQAAADYRAVLRLSPRHGDAAMGLGVATFQLGQFKAAGDAFATALQTGDPNLSRYAALWLYVSRERGGASGEATLKASANRMDLRLWPGPVIARLLGRIDTEKLLAEVAKASGKSRKERECVAYFYLGEAALLAGRKDEASQHFRKVLDSEAFGFRQYWAAKTELQRLN